jgi:tRNA 2-selenouridine synthase
MSCLAKPRSRAGDSLSAALLRPRLIVLTGPTGSGKTDFLRHLILRGAQGVDLEALAGHRGSAFGGLHGQRQPSPAEFKQRIVRYLRAAHSEQPIWIEEKGRYLGSLAIPQLLLDRISQADAVLLRCETSVRIYNLVASYGALPPRKLAKALMTLRNRLPAHDLERANRMLTDSDTPGAVRVVLKYYDAAYPKPDPQRIIAQIDISPSSIDHCADYLMCGIRGM